MSSLNVDDEAWAGIAAFYSIIHIPREEVTQVLREFRRVLQPNGLLLLAFHIGDGYVHLDEWWGRPVSVDFLFFRTEEMAGFLGQAGFRVAQVPSLALVKGRRVVARLEGRSTAPKIESLLDSHVREGEHEKTSG